MADNKEQELFKHIIQKGSLKMDVYDITFKLFQDFKQEVKNLVDKYKSFHDTNKSSQDIAFTYQDKGDFEFEIKFAGDVLLFFMHSNIFEIPRDHEVMKTRYIKDDKDRSYCGMIHIYNFLSDSLKYNRENDTGYLIGRLFINKEQHYFIEGKKEIGMIYHNFEKSVLNNQAIQDIITSAIEYTVNFDLLIPPYENVSLLSVQGLQNAIQVSQLSTGKRVGFKFQADKKEVKGLHNKS
jgi:hypothetical protein